MGKRKKPAVKKISDLKDKIEAYRASALAAGSGRGRSPAGPGKLALASAAAGGAALAITPAAEAVIQYSGLQNIMLTGRVSNIDVDGDGNGDFSIGQYNIRIDRRFFAAAHVFLNGGESLITSGGYVQALSANYNISSTNNLTGAGTWKGGNRLRLGLVDYGLFPDAGNKYIGVRFNNATDNKLHYGWIQVNLAADSASLTIVDWAWEDEGHTPILAGAGATLMLPLVGAGPPGPPDVFGGFSVDGFPGLKSSSWYLNYNVDFWPWIFHEEHGWQWVDSESTEEVIFVWDLGFGEWLYFNENTYRWMFLFGDNGGWIWTYEDNTPERRFFQRFDDGSLFSVPARL